MRSGRRSTLVALLGVVAMLAAVPAVADTADAAPYHDHRTSQTCIDGVGVSGACTISLDADQTTGAMSGDVLVESPEGGQEAGVVVANTTTAVVARHDLATASPAVLYTVGVRVNSAEANVGSLPSTAGLDVRLDVRYLACPSCEVQQIPAAHDDVVEGPSGRHEVTDELFEISALVTTSDGSALPPGPMDLTAIVATHHLVVGSGTSRITYDAMLESVDVDHPEVHTLSGALTAEEDFGCEGDDLGTTATCDASGNSAAGSVGVDLSVTSPLDGTLPGDGWSEGEAWVTGPATVSGSARAVVYVVRAEIDTAQLEDPVAIPPVSRAGSQAELSLAVTGAVTDRPVSSGSTGAVSGILTLVNTDLEARVIPDRRVGIGLASSVWIERAAGTALADVAATLKSATAYVFR